MTYKIELIDDINDVEKYRVVDENGKECFDGTFYECQEFIYGNLTL